MEEFDKSFTPGAGALAYLAATALAETEVSVDGIAITALAALLLNSF